MQIVRTVKPGSKTADLKLWHCEGCGVVHMSVGKMMINFDRAEFADFADAVAEVASTPGGDRYSIIDLAAGDDERASPGGNFIH